jgi:iron-sulfur cluster assembly protein
MSEQATTTQAASGQAAPSAGEVKPAAKGITLHDSAVRRLNKMKEELRAPEGGLRLAVRGGGCSGLTYAMDWAERPREKDKVFEREGARVFVDSKSYLYLNGTEIVYEESFMASGFKLNNPNVKGACGCGESFSVS